MATVIRPACEAANGGDRIYRRRRWPKLSRKRRSKQSIAAIVPDWLPGKVRGDVDGPEKSPSARRDPGRKAVANPADKERRRTSPNVVMTGARGKGGTRHDLRSECLPPKMTAFVRKCCQCKQDSANAVCQHHEILCTTTGPGLSMIHTGALCVL